ncbi:MAG: hypothetical protein JNK05_19075 [Myxococcales bacterium]|nr:hypothetical protein [Myxococcales bacterium]
MTEERFRIAHGAVPEAVRDVCQTIHRAGHGAWIVGGCVRDLLLGRPVADWDVCTSARPEQVQKLFRHVIPTGIKHGTVTVVLDRVHYEVTTLRGEGAYSDGRRPDEVYFVDDVREDLARRDFTVNAIAYDVARDEFMDPFEGRLDLSRRVVRAVGDGNERFREDGLRVLRAARFAATLEFELDAATRDAIRPNLPTFRRVSRERIHDEWLKTMKARRPSRAFVIMNETGILDEIDAELARASRLQAPDFNGTQLDLALAVMDAIAPGDAILRLSALFLAMPEKFVLRYAKENKFSTRDGARLAHLTECVRTLPIGGDTSDATLRRWLKRATREGVADIATVARARATVLAARDGIVRSEPLEATLARIEAIRARRDPLEPGELAVNGEDLQRELGLAPSKELGLVLRALMEAALDDPAVNTRESLLEAAKLALADARR